MLLAPVIGSVASALVIAVAVYGSIRVLALRFTVDLPRGALLSAGAFAAFFLAEALAGLAHWNGPATLGEIGENSIFLGLAPCYLLLTERRAQLLARLLAAAPWWAFIALAIAVFQQFALDLRPQGGAGNSGVFAVTVAILLAFNLANALQGRGAGNAPLALAGVLAASATLLLSQTRALWPCLVIFPAVVWLTAGRATGGRLVTRRVVATAAAVLVSLAVFGATIGDRARQAVADFNAFGEGQYATPVGKRLVVWKVAMSAIGEHPILGHGPDAPRRLMEERSLAVGGAKVVFSHFHNFMLNEMARAGIVGTAAMLAMFCVPLFVAARSRRDPTATTGLGLLICIQIAFLLSGSVNIMLDHDIMDTQFVAGTALCLYLALGRGEKVAAEAAKRISLKARTPIA